MTGEVDQHGAESARAGPQGAQAAFDQLAELNRETLLAWTRGLEGTLDQVEAALRPIDDPVCLDALRALSAFSAGAMEC